MTEQVEDPLVEMRNLVREIRGERAKLEDVKIKGYGDENTRMLTEELQVAVQKLRRLLANYGNYIPSLEAYASGLAELPTDIDALIEQRILAEVTLDDRFIRTVQKLAGARSWGAWLGRHIGMVVGLIVLGVVSGLLIYRLTEQDQFNALMAATGNINWLQASAIVASAAVIAVVGFLAWRQHRNQSRARMGGEGLA